MPDYYLYPDGTDLNESNAWSNESASTANQHLSIDETGTPDDDTTFTQCNSSGGNRALRLTLSPMTAMVGCSAITLEIRVRDNSGGGAHVTMVMFLYIGGVEYTLTPSSQLMTGSYVDYTFTTSSAGINPATGLPFTQADLNALILGVRQNIHGTSVGRVTRARIKVTYTPVSGDISKVRQIGSLGLRKFRRPLMQLPAETLLAFLDLELGDDFSVTHFAGPHPQGLGWGLTNWKRRLFRLMEVDPDFNTMTLNLKGEDRHGFLCNTWETLEAVRSALAEDGNALVTCGLGSTFTRASDLWGEDPSSRLIVRYGADAKALVYQGMLMEAVAKNYLQRSSAISGTTGVTPGGVGGSFTTETPTDPLFDSTVTTSCWVLTSAAATKTATWPVSDTITANTKFRLLIDHRDAASSTLRYRITRASDGFFWNDSTGAWQVGAVDNSLTFRAARTRDWTKVINIGAGSTTITVQLSVTATGQTSRIYHLEAVGSAGVTSRIVTDAATYTRAVPTYFYSHQSGGNQRAMRSEGGTFIGYITPLFDSADFSGSTVVLWAIDLDAGDLFRLQWNGTSGNLEFAVKTASGTVTATKAITWTRDTEVVVACRWTTAAGELGLTARTSSVFVNGSKGTDASRADDPADFDSILYAGCDGSAAGNWKIRRWLWTQEVLTDEEVARGAP